MLCDYAAKAVDGAQKSNKLTATVLTQSGRTVRRQDVHDFKSRQALGPRSDNADQVERAV